VPALSAPNPTVTGFVPTTLGVYGPVTGADITSAYVDQIYQYQEQLNDYLYGISQTLRDINQTTQELNQIDNYFNSIYNDGYIYNEFGY
jgi:hypothetical protein